MGKNITLEQAIEISNSGEDISPYYDDAEQAIEIAIIAMERLIPKKPIVYCLRDTFAHLTVYSCPECTQTIQAINGALIPMYPYCPHCGQSLDWNIKNKE